MPPFGFDEMDILGKYGLRLEWELPQAYTPEEEFNKEEYYKLVGIKT